MAKSAYMKRLAAKRFDEMPVGEYAALPAIKKLSVLASEWDEAKPTHKHYLEGRMLEVTIGMEEHPEWFNHNCLCDLCLSYSD